MYQIAIERKTLENNNFRKVLATTNNMQLVIMSLKPYENINREKHDHGDQFIRIEDGECDIIITDDNKNIIQTSTLQKNDAAIIKENTWHEIINKNNILKIYTIYTPPQHKDMLVQQNKPINDNILHGGKRTMYIKKFTEILDRNHIE